MYLLSHDCPMLINLTRVLVVMGLLKLFQETCFSSSTKLAFQCRLQKLLLDWKDIYNFQSNSQISFQRYSWYALKVNILEISKEMSKKRFFSFDFESEKFGMGKGEEKKKKRKKKKRKKKKKKKKEKKK